MEATAVSLARTVLDGVLGSAATAMADEAALLLGVRREVDFIRSELEMMRSFLRSSAAACSSAGGGCCKDTLKTCVKQVRDLACDLEDCLLDFSLHAARPPWLRLADLAARHRVADRIRGLKATVDELNQRNQRYNVFVVDKAVPAPPADKPPQHGHDAEHLLHPDLASGSSKLSQVVGRDEDKEALREKLVKGAGVVSAVWGMGGMGKSSLVTMLYNDRALIDGFDCRAWVTVPRPLESPDEFGRRLEKQLGVDNGRGVSAWIKEKRCLVVVDDVSSGEEWDHIRPCFDAICDGGRVVVTTRREDVARQCAGDNVYELKPLAPGEALKLLCQKVYKDDEYKLSEHMKEEANLILRRCRGLPLAIATIGGLLANRPKTSREWMNLGDHLGSELEYDRDIMRVITSSYDGLPYHLKTCFLYLSIFPENYEIRCTRLLRRWMAEGYIAKPRDMTIEEVGRRHYKELINRSMIQPSKKVRASMAVERCRVHGVVLQIILSKSVEENQLFIMDNHCNEAPQSKIRHLVVTRRKKSENMSSINLSLIRSLTVFGECPLSLITPKLRLLRVLDLEDTIGLENDDLKHVGELRHLRYLGLRGTNISALPSSLQNLVCLETLDVQDTKVTWFPHGITKLENLRYLVGGINFAKDLVEKMGKKNATKGNNNCSKTLADFVCGCYGGYKEQSQCLCSGCTCEFSVRAPERIEKLRNLLVLGVLHIAQGSEVARNLGKLTNLRRLGVDLEADGGAWMELCSSISRLVRLERLEVRSESLEFLKDTSKDKSPPKHLTSLRLCGRLGNLPSWMSSLNDLSKVKLLRTQLKQEEIRVLGKLGNLTLLGLWEDSFMEESLCFSNGTFKKLKLLYIEGLKNLKTIQIEDGTLTVLENLRVRKCLQLHDGEKGFSGVVFLRNLNELALTSCGEKPELEKALQLQIVGLANRPTLITGKSIVLRSAPSLRHFLPMEADCA